MLNAFLLLTKISESSVDVTANKLTTKHSRISITEYLATSDHYPLGGILDLSRMSRKTIYIGYKNHPYSMKCKYVAGYSAISPYFLFDNILGAY